ncbi:MAG: polynucleotide adenylyltransferase PcnB [Treponema sp.]|nr:polynucleotide adenylyltransferase PcnB [Treponema sp.]
MFYNFGLQIKKGGSEGFLRIRYGKEENGALVKKAAVYTRDEHRINFADVDRDAVFVCSRLRAGGFETYIVGGAVRDLMLGKKPKDFDIVTGATPAQIKKIFRNSRIIGRRFRLVHVFFGPRIFEVSTFRSLKDGHTSNTYGSIEEDVLRRDFSINALFYDPEKQVVVDYVKGMADIRRKKIRPIIPADLIFKDDPVRMIRALKYAGATGFSVPWTLKRRIKKEAALLGAVSPSRRTEELFKIINSPHVERIVESLEDAGLYRYLQAEASARLKEDAGFRRRYFLTLADLGVCNGNGAEKQGGRVLMALVQDYLADTHDWDALKKGGWEEYKAVFFAARRFILPMNPPRADLEKAVRLVFAGYGIELKKARIFDERRRGGGNRSGGPAAEHQPKAAQKNEDSPAGGKGRRGPRPKR